MITLIDKVLLYIITRKVPLHIPTNIIRKNRKTADVPDITIRDKVKTINIKRRKGKKKQLDLTLHSEE